MIVVAGLYQSRLLIISPLIVKVAEQQIRESLGIVSEVKGLSGSFINSVRLDRIRGEAEDPDAQIRAILLEGVQVRYNIFKLLKGDLSAISIEAGRAALVLDLDRKGLRQKDKPKRSNPAIGNLPLVNIASGAIYIAQKKQSINLEGLGLSLSAPDTQGFQAGRLQVREAGFVIGKGDQSFRNVICPLNYGKGAISLGPIVADQDSAIITADVSFDPSNILNKIEANAQGSILGGDISLNCIIDPDEKTTFEADFTASRIDSMRVAFWTGKLFDVSQPLSGRLSVKCFAKGVLDDIPAMNCAAECSLEDGKYDYFSGLDLDLKGTLQKGFIGIERCDLVAGKSKLHISAGKIPFDWRRLDPHLTSFRYTFYLEDCERWLKAARLDDEKYASLQNAVINGRGGVDGRRILLEELNLDLIQGKLTLKDTSVALQEGSTEFEIKLLEGVLFEHELALTAPLEGEINKDNLNIRQLKLNLDDGSIWVEGGLNYKAMTADLKGGIAGLESTLVNDFIPSEKIKWENLKSEFSLHGPVKTPEGKLSLTAAKFNFNDKINLERIALQAEFFAQKIEINSVDLSLQEGGSIAGNLLWRFQDDEFLKLPGAVDCNLKIDKLKPAALCTIWPPLTEAEGVLNGEASISGDLENPDFNIKLNGDIVKTPNEILDYLPDQLKDPGGWKIYLDLKKINDTARLERFIWEGKYGDLSVNAEAPVKMKLFGEDKGLTIPEDGSVTGKVAMSRVDLGSLNIPAKLEGISSIDAEFSGPLNYLEGQFSANLAKVSYDKTPPGFIDIQGSMAKGILTIYKLELSTAEESLVRGEISFNLNGDGPATLATPGPDTPFEISLAINSNDISPYARAFDQAYEGCAAFTINGQGLLKEPHIDIDASLTELMVPRSGDNESGEESAESEPAPISLKGTMALGKDGLLVNDIKVGTTFGDLHGSGEAPIGIGWDRIKNGKLFDMDGVLKVRLESTSIDLASFKPFMKNIRRLEGTLSTSCHIDGSLGNPKVKANLDITNAALRFETRLPSLEKLNISATADENGIDIARINGAMGGGDFHIEGRIPFLDFKPHSYDLQINGDHLLFYRGGGVKIRSDLALELSGPLEAPVLKGRVDLCESKFVKHIPLLPGKGPPSVPGRKQLFSLTDPFGRKLNFDVEVGVIGDKGLYIDNNLARGEVDLNLALKGTGEIPFLVGEASFDDLTIFLPNFNFRVDTGRLIFSKQDISMPSLDLFAYGRRQSYDVSAAAYGPLDDLEILLTSSPPLDNDAVTVLVTTGILPKRVTEQSASSQAMKQVGAYLGKELFHEIFGSETTESGESILDRFTLDIGTEVSRDGVDNIILEYKMEGPWHLQLERDIYRDTNMGVVYRIRFK